MQRPNNGRLEMDRAVYPHDVHSPEDVLDAVPVCAYEHQLTFLMSYPICEHGKRTRKSGPHTADAILFLASGNAAESGEVVRVFAPYVVKKEKGQKIIQTLSVSRN